MQSFLQSADPPEVIIGKFDADAKPEPTDHRIVTTCLEVRHAVQSDHLYSSPVRKYRLSKAIAVTMASALVLVKVFGESF